MPLTRYDSIVRVSTPLDPMTAVLGWIRGLRSLGLSSELLVKHHGFSKGPALADAASEIANHAEMAVSLLESALSGPAHIAYLNAYYGLLDLAKVVIIASGKLKEVRDQKWHGIAWSGIKAASQDLRTDHVTLHSYGAGGLFFEALTGVKWTSPKRKQRRVLMGAVYPLIRCVGFEYRHIYGGPGLASVLCEPQQIGDTARAVITFTGDDESPAKLGRGFFKILTGLTKVDDRTFATTAVPLAGSTPELVAAGTLRRRHLLYSSPGQIQLGSAIGPTTPALVKIHGFATPVSNSNLLMPEEIPIFLAFFHLGNVVRYDPSRLAKLRDSRACAIVDVLLSEGIFVFLTRIWSYLHQAEHVFL